MANKADAATAVEENPEGQNPEKDLTGFVYNDETPPNEGGGLPDPPAVESSPKVPDTGSE